MGREIELKLTIDTADVDRFVHHSLISRCLGGPVTKKRLVNRYFDTPDQILRHHSMALRVRWDGNVYIQTLKHKGRSRCGLTERGEWEWLLESPGIDILKVPMDLWPAAVQSRLDELVPLFETNFERTLWPLAISPGSFPGTRISATVEMALDQGEIRVADGGRIVKDNILEIELELREGDSEILRGIYEQLTTEIRLKPSDVSKAERGYRLFTGNV